MANINKKISTILSEASLVLHLNLDILVSQSHHTHCGMSVHSLVLDTLYATLSSH